MRVHLDTLLTAVVALLLVAVLGFGGYFGYTVYRDRKATKESSPAYRVIKVAKAQVREAPNDPAARVRLGEALAAAGESEEAIEQFNAALKLDPKHTGAYLDLGLLAMSLKRPVEAERYFQKIIELTEGSEFQDVNQRRETALYNLGLLSLNEKEYEEAIGYFKAALRIRKDASDTYYYLARALYLTGEVDGAIQQVEAALAFDPNFAQAHYFFGELYMAKDDKVNASYEYHKAATIVPDAPEPKEALAQFGTPEALVAQARSESATDLEAALKTILIARNVDPESVEAAVVHAEILVQRKNLKDALDVYKQAAELDPSNQKIKDAIADLTEKV